MLRDPKQPDREAHGRYFPKTDTLQLLINGPAGPIAQPDAEPAWGITTNYYTHILWLTDRQASLPLASLVGTMQGF